MAEEEGRVNFLLDILLGVFVILVPVGKMRYANTAGDWQFGPGDAINITVADTGSWRYNALLALHETIEALLCRRHGITQAQVDEFDILIWPQMVAHCAGEIPLSEPGDAAQCPYFHEHQTASTWERRAARLLLVNWDAYTATVDALFHNTTAS